jgi:hypothetical protein
LLQKNITIECDSHREDPKGKVTPTEAVLEDVGQGYWILLLALAAISSSVSTTVQQALDS